MRLSHAGARRHRADFSTAPTSSRPSRADPCPAKHPGCSWWIKPTVIEPVRQQVGVLGDKFVPMAVRWKVVAPSFPKGHADGVVHAFGTRQSAAGSVQRFRCVRTVNGKLKAHKWSVRPVPKPTKRQLIDSVMSRAITDPGYLELEIWHLGPYKRELAARTAATNRAIRPPAKGLRKPAPIERRPAGAAHNHRYQLHRRITTQTPAGAAELQQA